MFRKMLVTTLGVLAALGIAAPVAAQYGPTPTLVVSDPTVVAGQTVTVSGTGCEPGETVDIEFDGDPLDTTEADDDGAFTIDVTIPDAAAPGTHTITATCGALVQRATVTIPGEDIGEGALPRTGSSNVGPLAAVGVGLVVVGGLLLLRFRRRRPASVV